MVPEDLDILECEGTDNWRIRNSRKGVSFSVHMVGNDLVYRIGRFGKFISCSTYPTCKYTAKLKQEAKEAPEPTGKMCPECGAELLKRKSRYGNYFLGCSAFPKCRHIESIEGEELKFKKRTGKKSKEKEESAE